MTHTIALFCISAYFIAAVLVMGQLWRPSRTGRTLRASRGLFFCAFALHSLTMLLVFRDGRLVALENGADHFLWVSWALALVCLVARRWFSDPLLGAFAIPAIVLFMTSSSLLLHQGAPSLIVQEAQGARESLAVSLMHAVPALVAVVSLVLALIVSAVFLIVERRLKQRSVIMLNSGGPNLQALDALNKHLVQIGFVALSLVIVSGGLWAVLQRKAILTADTSVVSGVVVWLLLALILHARLIMRWSPKRVSKLTVLVTGSFFMFVFLAIAFAGRITHANLWWWS
jgi:ABC-type transport system involved in cytochrome c biogenesis permease subunit